MATVVPYLSVILDPESRGRVMSIWMAVVLFVVLPGAIYAHWRIYKNRPR